MDEKIIVENCQKTCSNKKKTKKKFLYKFSIPKFQSKV